MLESLALTGSLLLCLAAILSADYDLAARKRWFQDSQSPPDMSKGAVSAAELLKQGGTSSSSPLPHSPSSDDNGMSGDTASFQLQSTDAGASKPESSNDTQAHWTPNLAPKNDVALA